MEKAIELCTLASDHGFGNLVDEVMSTRKQVKFRKNPYELLSSHARNIMREIQITKNINLHLSALA